MSDDGVSQIERLSFLVRDYGFVGPWKHFVSRDFHSTYRRGEDVVDVVWDGAPTPIIKLIIGGQQIITWRLSVERAVEIMRTHPETLRGDYQALGAAEAEAWRAAERAEEQ